MCTDIIPTNLAQNQLETVVNSLLQPAYHSGTKDCGLEADGRRRLDTTQAVKQECLKLRQRLTSELLRARQSSPNLKCLRLMDSVGGYTLPRAHFIAINKRDFLSGKTSSYPLFYLRSKLQADIYALRMLQDGIYEDSCGTFDELEQILEGSPWVETITGSRLALKNATSHTQKQFRLKESTLEGSHVYKAKSSTRCNLWDLEWCEGRTLLFTKEVEGFPDVEVLKREVLEYEVSEESESDDEEWWYDAWI